MYCVHLIGLLSIIIVKLKCRRNAIISKLWQVNHLEKLSVLKGYDFSNIWQFEMCWSTNKTKIVSLNEVNRNTVKLYCTECNFVSILINRLYPKWQNNLYLRYYL